CSLALFGVVYRLPNARSEPPDKKERLLRGDSSLAHIREDRYGSTGQPTMPCKRGGRASHTWRYAYSIAGKNCRRSLRLLKRDWTSKDKGKGRCRQAASLNSQPRGAV